MSHVPVNHHLRPLYRVLAGLSACWLLVFGGVGWYQTRGSAWFDRGDWSALGVATNRALAVASLVAGVLVLLAVLAGRNLDRAVNFSGGIAFLVAGTLMLALLNTEGNVLNFSVATTVVSYVVGMLLLTAGLYGKVGTTAQAAAEEAYRHGG